MMTRSASNALSAIRVVPDLARHSHFLVLSTFH
jgi:hypothetical protein